MGDTKDSNNLETANQTWSNWGYDLVCTQIFNKRISGISEKDDLQQLFDYVSGHETCFLEFKGTPFKPSKEKSANNPYGYSPDETSDDYAWNVVKSIIALANTAGGAVILGITDKGHEPISEICENLWENDHWDGFSRNLFNRILHRSYDILKDTTPSGSMGTKHAQAKPTDLDDTRANPCKLAIDLDDTACDKLRNLCAIKCCHHKGHLIPIILVQAVQNADALIFAKERANAIDILLVRDKGDAGQTIKLTGREIRRYEQPDEATYTLSRNATTPRPERPFHNLCCIPNFVGRTDDLDRLKRSFVNDAHIQWIQGDPGIGKTAFIQKFIAKHCGDSPEDIFDFAFFINAQGLTCAQAICQISSNARLFEDFCGISLNEGQSNPYDKIFNSPEVTKPRLFKSWACDIIERLNDYHKRGKILIALDNVDNSAFFNDDQLDWILNAALNGSIRFCVTSRTHPDNNGLISKFPLSHLTEGDALDILDLKKPIRHERESAEKIVKRVDCNAWAIKLIGTQIEHDSGPNPYARKLGELKNLGISSALSDKSSGESLNTLYKQSIERLKNGQTRGDEALHLFALSAWFQQDAIPEIWLMEAFKRYLNSLKGQWAEDEWSRSVGILLGEGLFQWCPENNSYRVQPLAQEVLWALPETYENWRHVFETIKEALYAENSNDVNSFPQWHGQLINFIDKTLTSHAADKASQGTAYKNAVEIVKWIASAPRWKILLRTVVENFGNIDVIRRICTNLFTVAKDEYGQGRCSDEAIRHYFYFLSIQKIVTTRYEQDINAFKELSQNIRSVFERIPQKTEKEEIEFAQELISDIKQYDKLYPYPIIEKDLEKAQDIVLKYKDQHLGLLVKACLERANIELEFRKYRKVRKSLKRIIDITREAEKDLPVKNLLMFCKEQLAYMHLCKCASSGPLGRLYHGWRASSRYSNLTEELSSPSLEEQTPGRTSRKLLLFKSRYFMALTLLQKKKIPAAHAELDTALNMCDQVFVPDEDEVKTAAEQTMLFNNLRIKSGIYRLKNQQEEAQNKDKEAYTFHEQNVSRQPNLDIADLLDDYGNSYALRNTFDKAISYVNQALDIRKKLLPSTHAKIFNSYNRLAYLYGINAMKNGELAHKEIEKLLDDRDRTGDGEKLRSSSESILRKLGKVMKFGNLSGKVFLEQLKKDEQREESERVRTLISLLQEKLFDKWVMDHSTNQ